MKKSLSILMCFVLVLSTLTFASITASAKSKLSTDKTEYLVGEDILVIATGSGDQWVGLYKKSEVPGTGNASYYWYYVNKDGYVSGETYAIQNTCDNKRGSLIAGDYEIHLFADSGYKVVETVCIKIVDTVLTDFDSLEYKLDDETDGFANGTVSVTMSSKTASECVLFWGDENGNPLEDYTQITRFKLTGNTTEITMPTHLVIPTGAKKLLAYASNGINLSNQAASFDLPENSQYDLSTEGVLAEFQMVSDTHVTTSSTASGNKHLKMMLEDVKDNSKNSIGIFIDGDVTDSGTSEEFEQVKSIYNSVKRKAKNLPLLHIAIGNHDWSGGNPNAQFQSYAKIFNDSLETQPEKVYYDEIVGGYHFVYLGSEKGGLYATISKEQLEWFDNLMAECTQENPDKPVFVMLHQSFYNTVAGSLAGQGWNGVNDEQSLKKVMAKYNQIILFNGHSHWEFDSSSNMFAGNTESPIAFNTASVSYLWTSFNTVGGQHLDGSQGYYVRVYQDKVVLLGRDFANKKYVASAIYVVENEKLELEKDEFEISDDHQNQTIKVNAHQDLVVKFASLDESIVTVSQEGVLIPKAMGKTKVLVYIEGTNTKVISKKYVTVRVVHPSAHLVIPVIDEAVSPTCTQTGLTQGSHCSHCGDVLVKQEVIPPLGHTEVIDEAVEPTYTQTGLTQGSHCSVCNEVLVEQVIVPMLNPTVTTPSTVAPTEPTTQPTTITTTATTTTTTTTTTVPTQSTVAPTTTKCKHTSLNIVKKAKSTYFAKGYTGDTVCGVCGYRLSKGKSVAKLTLKVPSFKLTSGKKQFKVKYTKVKDATGFQVRYKIKGNWKTATFDTKKTATKVIKKLKKGTYQVQVRAMIKKNGNKAYSSWSKTKKVIVK